MMGNWPDEDEDNENNEDEDEDWDEEIDRVIRESDPLKQMMGSILFLQLNQRLRSWRK